jgi:Sulfatase-modifying factor enzyme 1
MKQYFYLSIYFFLFCCFSLTAQSIHNLTWEHKDYDSIIIKYDLVAVPKQVFKVKPLFFLNDVKVEKTYYTTDSVFAGNGQVIRLALGLFDTLKQTMKFNLKVKLELTYDDTLFHHFDTLFKDKKKLYMSYIKTPNNSFFISTTAVSVREWNTIMAIPEDGSTMPKTHVSALDVAVFLTKLNAKTHKNYRLPQPEEWDFVAQNDTTISTFHSVLEGVPNKWLIKGLVGNTQEWCRDIATGRYLLRGCSYLDKSRNCHKATHNSYPNIKDKKYGFRIALDSPIIEPQKQSSQ